MHQIRLTCWFIGGKFQFTRTVHASNYKSRNKKKMWFALNDECGMTLELNQDSKTWKSAKIVHILPSYLQCASTWILDLSFQTVQVYCHILYGTNVCFERTAEWRRSACEAQEWDRQKKVDRERKPNSKTEQRQSKKLSSAVWAFVLLSCMFIRSTIVYHFTCASSVNIQQKIRPKLVGSIMFYSEKEKKRLKQF